jgi:hypothetical protein
MPSESLKAMTETLYRRKSRFCCQLPLPEYADYIVVPSSGITGEIVTPYGVSDWSATAQASGHWDILAKIEAPRGEITIYKNNLPGEARNFETANAWIQRRRL